MDAQIAAEEAAMWEEQGGMGFLRHDYDPETQVEQTQQSETESGMETQRRTERYKDSDSE